MHVFRRFVLLLLLVAFAAAAGSAQKPVPADPAPLGKVTFPPYQTRKLSNGLTVYALEHREQPVVAIRLLIAAGAANDPADVSGVASMTADLLNQGTKTRSATDIAAAIDQVGGMLEASADMDSTTVSAGVLTDSVDLAFELMTDIVLNPAFDEDEIGRLQEQALSSLTADMDDADFVANAVLDRVVYGSHPYGHLQSGTLESIPKIKRADLVKFHETYYAPNTSALAIVGDMSAEEAFKLAERWFGSWQQKEVPQPAMASPSQANGRRIVVIDKPDAVQTEIRVGQLTVPRNDPDYFNVLVTSYILGGSGSGRLYQNLRVQRGLTYGAYATITPRTGPGLFYVVTDTRTEKTNEALQVTLDVIQKLRGGSVPDQELKDAKAFLIGSFPLSIEVPNDLATRLTTIFLYQLGDSYLDTFRDRIAAVSTGDVQRISRDKIMPDNLAVVLVGNASQFRKALEPMGKLEVISMGDLDLDSVTLKRAN
jgi:zinc protease